MSGSGDIDVYVITGDTNAERARPSFRAGRGSMLREYAAAATAIGLTTALGLVTRPWLQTVDFAMLYLLAVVLVLQFFFGVV